MTSHETDPETRHGDELEDHDLGLSHDLPQIVAKQRRLGRRGMLGVFGGLGATAVLAGCALGDDTDTSLSSAPDGGRPGAPGGGAAGSTVAVADGEIPEETAGP
ncbi:hypothetical protein ACT8ZV_04140 [Nocardioides sp. MAHUQ-72]|uniref:hypothetical protein n=1 Tax=unclassified Nocardioides TaxID=2615069 RepID=UPI00360645D9